MKKFILPAVFAALIIAVTSTFTGCAKTVDYSSYISEKRSNIYLYEDDSVAVKIYCCEKEQPYAADGYKGNVNPLIEIFVSLPQNPEKLEISVGGHSGEMNYQSVQNRFYLSFSAEEFTADRVDVMLKQDGEEKTYTALSVKYAGVMSCEEALKCVVEHDKELFDGLTQDGIFGGEIYVRLLYDEGCYYYIGVCDKGKQIHAYLIDGERGIVIAAKELQA